MSMSGLLGSFQPSISKTATREQAKTTTMFTLQRLEDFPEDKTYSLVLRDEDQHLYLIPIPHEHLHKQPVWKLVYLLMEGLNSGEFRLKPLLERFHQVVKSDDTPIVWN